MTSGLILLIVVFLSFKGVGLRLKLALFFNGFIMILVKSYFFLVFFGFTSFFVFFLEVAGCFKATSFGRFGFFGDCLVFTFGLLPLNLASVVGFFFLCLVWDRVRYCRSLDVSSSMVVGFFIKSDFDGFEVCYMVI